MKFFVVTLLLSFFLCCFVVPSEQIFCPRCKAGTFQGQLFGAPYTIVIPNDWNEVLIVYARDYQEEKPATADAFWPGFDPNQNFSGPLLERGYALAGSALSSGGWAVSNGINDILALTAYFRLRHCWPKYTILVGVSMGGVIAQKSIERFNFIYDAAIPACSLSAGTTRTLDLSLRWNIAFSAINGGWPSFFGAAPNDISSTLTNDEVFGTYFPLYADPEQRFLAGLEFIRNIMHIEPSSIYYDPPDPYLFIDATFATTVLAQIEQKYGGPVTQNVGHAAYNLTSDQVDVLNLLLTFSQGVYPADAVSQWLNFVNSPSQIYTANKKARAKLACDGDFDGKVTGPVLTLHTTIDPLAPVQGETVYKQTLTKAKRANKLVQVFTQSRAGHCEFNPDHFVGAITAVHSWLKTRKVPDPNSDEFFPATAGFAHGFEPGPWLWD